MSTRTVFWPDLRRIIAQWAGVVLASILSGVLLGILLRWGFAERLAFGIALATGFLLALVFWIVIGRQFKPVAIEYTIAVSPVGVQYEGADTMNWPTPAFAAAVLCVTLISYHPAQRTLDQGATSAIHHAIPEL
ncbi:MAG TPA: hypothetical protein VK302_10620 [Terriglobales bacterium]|nr:hypothetical protein [Terriglobales bacterium]